MKRLTIRERGRINRSRFGRTSGENRLDACYLDERSFNILRTYDQSREDGTVFDWRDNFALVGPWVGVVQMPGLLLEIVPKIENSDGESDGEVIRARDNLLVMLGEAGDVPLRSRDIADLGTRKEALHETLLATFARRLRFELLRGADQSYVGEVDDLRVMRGKLLVGRHVARNAARRERFTCAFDDFTPDTTLNRILKAACKVLVSRTRSGDVGAALSHCLLLLDDVTDVTNASSLLGRVVISRQNDRFADLISFSKLVLQQLSPTTVSGRSSVFSLLFQMDRVFEGFISAMAKRAARRLADGTRVFPQARMRRRHLMMDDQGGVLRLKPDLFIESRSGPLVIDAKWKRRDSSLRGKYAGSLAPDLYQLYAYTRRYGAKRSVLLFPHVGDATDRAFSPLAASGAADGTRIEFRFVRLDRNLRRRHEFNQIVDEIAVILGSELQSRVQSEELAGIA